MSIRFLPALAATLALALTSSTARAQITHLETFMDGAQEIPPVPTPATGRGDFIINTVTHTLKYNVSFQNLLSAQNNAHIHVTSTTGILFPLPLGSPISGTIGMTPAQEATMLPSGATYTNIHTVGNPGGEIRGANVLAPQVGTKMCFGDGSSGPCPCGNTGAIGHGCDNSVATGGSLLEATGHVSPDNVVLIATGERATALSIFLQGNLMVAPTVFGDGLRCTGGQLKRLSTKSATGGAVAFPEGGEPQITVRAAALGQPNNPGDTRWYQTYYRDPDAVFCAIPVGNTFNISNAIQLTW